MPGAVLRVWVHSCRHAWDLAVVVVFRWIEGCRGSAIRQLQHEASDSGYASGSAQFRKL